MKRLGIVGCGAVARRYYAPALLKAEAGGKLKLAGAFDPDTRAAHRFLDDFPDASAEATLEGLLGIAHDQVIIASPPAFHREQAIAALRRKIPVHCEKPLATGVDDALAMIAEARRAGTRLSVNMVRRKLLSAQSIGSMMMLGSIGELRSIEIFEGGPFSWPVDSPAYFDPASGAVGVLDDLGTHILDLLCWWLGAATGITYCDDAMGGIAANCLIQASFGIATARIRLSRDWHRPNRWTLIGSEGLIVWNREDESVEAEVGSSRWRLSGAGSGQHQTFEQAFAAPIEAIANDSPDSAFVLAGDILPSLQAVEACKAVRTAMAMPWLK
ncbi:Gfo/Idh/MocA family protein [Sphingomonas sp. URHD0057]|uniref:Gfo/Idh/MocA family protein n=1 Tax=Sphingomonas sp. URHD0057 TaxID=1380389 RepID=UPI00068546B2|nr:Gfo/Idh/MocA family oxidoreductase [Sphingomonas sp. URHD0057]